MIREKYSIMQNEFSINITDGKIDSVRTKDIKKSALRVYDGQYIGIKGVYGEVKDDDWTEALNNLGLKIPYPHKPTMNLNCNEGGNFEFDENKFLKDVREFLAYIKTEFPQFVVFNKVSLNDNLYSIVNDEWLELSARKYGYIFSLILKEKGTPNVFDSSFLYAGRNYNLNDLKKYFYDMFSVYDKRREVPKKKTPVIIQTDYMMRFFEKHLNGRSLGTKSSIFNDKLGEKLFSEKFSLTVDKKNSFIEPFFDLEGTSLANDEIFLIENGVFKRPYVDKATAKKYGYELTSSAGGEFDSVPSPSPVGLHFKNTANSIEELIEDREAIFVQMSAGGDYTDSGDFAAPIMDSYLLDRDGFKNRLQEFTLTGNVYDIFGKNFIGTLPYKNVEGYNLLVFETEIL
ncbi:MAG: metallopeptidase TldD-related protein [Tissierellia bacterium]|nr:metallopeptidase TldD-related protein [Tissierellia bacterium]